MNIGESSSVEDGEKDETACANNSRNHATDAQDLLGPVVVLRKSSLVS